MNPFEKPKKTTEDKVKIILQEYIVTRMFAGRYFMGDALCGGDPIGTALGLNNDVLKPINLEVGKSYEYEGNVNYSTIGFFSSITNEIQTIKTNIFSIAPGEKNIKITLTLVSDCTEGLSLGIYFCNTVILKYANYSCTKSPEIQLGSSPKLKNQFQSCNLNQNNIKYFIDINYNKCMYKIDIRENI